MRPAVCHKQPELLEHGVIFTRTMQHLIAIVMCKIWCSVGAGRCWYILATLQISHLVVIGCLYVWDSRVQGKRFESEDCINTARPLYVVWARMKAELELILYHIDGKSMWTVLLITLS